MVHVARVTCAALAAVCLLAPAAADAALPKAHPPKRTVAGVKVSWPVKAKATLKPGAKLKVRVQSKRRSSKLALVRVNARGRAIKTIKRKTLRSGTWTVKLPATSNVTYALQLTIAGKRYSSWITASKSASKLTSPNATSPRGGSGPGSSSTPGAPGSTPSTPGAPGGGPPQLPPNLPPTTVPVCNVAVIVDTPVLDPGTQVAYIVFNAALKTITTGNARWERQQPDGSWTLQAPLNVEQRPLEPGEAAPRYVGFPAPLEPGNYRLTEDVSFAAGSCGASAMTAPVSAGPFVVG